MLLEEGLSDVCAKLLYELPKAAIAVYQTHRFSAFGGSRLAKITI